MAISDWPVDERPREKLLQHGAANLSDAELLAIFLRSGVAGKSAVDLARDLLQEYGSIANILVADRQRFCRSKGLGKSKYTQLQAVLEMMRRYLKGSLQQKDALLNAGQTKRFIMTKLQHYQHEVFACLFLDNKHRIIKFEELFHGTINQASVHPREVVKRVFVHNAAAVIFAHNHPSGIAEPSVSDAYITKQLAQALALLDVRVLDHIIVGDGYVTSLSDRGLI